MSLVAGDTAGPGGSTLSPGLACPIPVPRPRAAWWKPGHHVEEWGQRPHSWASGSFFQGSSRGAVIVTAWGTEEDGRAGPAPCLSGLSLTQAVCIWGS